MNQSKRDASPANHPAARSRQFTRPRFGLLALLLLVTVAVRGGVLWLERDALSEDIDGYRRLTQQLVATQTLASGDFPTAYRPPLYPLLLAPCMAAGDWANVAIGALHLIVGVATVLVVVHLGERCGLGNLAIVAGALVALDPILLFWSTRTMTETVATLLAAVGLWSLTYVGSAPSFARALLAGATLALAALCRPTFLVWWLFCAVALALLPNQTWRRRSGLAIGLLVGGAMVLSPWVIRNAAVFGRPVVATTHGGYTLLLGNNPSFYAFLREGQWGAVWDAESFHEDYLREVPLAQSPADELHNDRYAYERAWDNVENAPGMFLYACVVRIGRLWWPLPHQVNPDESTGTQLTRYAVAAWYCGLYILAAFGLWNLGSNLRISPWIWTVLLAASFTAVHAFYWSDIRMRAPLIPAVALWAAAGVQRRIDRKAT